MLLMKREEKEYDIHGFDQSGGNGHRRRRRYRKGAEPDLAGLGADMVLTCRTSRTQCEELAREIEGMGRRVCILQGDISSSQDCARMAEEAQAFYGGPVESW